MTIREWIRDREISGFPTFSVEEIRLALPHYSEQVIKNDLFRISSQGIIYPVYKRFLRYYSSSLCCQKNGTTDILHRSVDVVSKQALLY